MNAEHTHVGLVQVWNLDVCVDSMPVCGVNIKLSEWGMDMPVCVASVCVLSVSVCVCVCHMCVESP